MSEIAHEFIGKVLIVDDQYNNELNSLVNNLLEKGFNVQYWNSNGSFYKSISNVRILILDLDLTGGVVRRGHETFFYAAAKVLGQIKGPYVVILYARDFVNEDIKEIKDAYEKMYETPFEGYIEGISGLTKGKGAEELIKIIFGVISKKNVYKLIISWEKLLDRSKDEGLRKFIRQKFESEVKEFVKSIGKDVGIESMPREFVSSMMRFVIRYMHRGVEYVQLEKLLKEIFESKTSGTVSDLLLQNRNMYFTPDSNENVWTGDIYKIKDNEALMEYRIILTPECDIAQDKADYYLLCKGFGLSFKGLKNKKHPIYSIDENFKIPDISGLDREQFESKIRKQLNKLKNDHDRYFTIWNYSEVDEKYFGLCFDFQNVETMHKDEFKTNYEDKRTSRLDMPYITELIQKFSNFSTRLGVPPVNKTHIDTN